MDFLRASYWLDWSRSVAEWLWCEQQRDCMSWLNQTTNSATSDCSSQSTISVSVHSPLNTDWSNFTMSSSREQQSVIVPRLNLKSVGSKSAPNSARSTKLNDKPTQSSFSSSTQDADQRYLAWKRRKDYRPGSSRYLLLKKIKTNRSRQH